MASQSDNNQAVSKKTNIKEETDGYELTLQIKPENEAYDYNTDENEDTVENTETEVKQEENNDLQDVLSSIETRLNKKLNEYNSSVKRRQKTLSRADYIRIKQEMQNPGIISDDYPSIDEGSMDSIDARALNNVEACLQEEVDIKSASVEGRNKVSGKYTEEMNLPVTETHLISNKVINTSSTVTMPHDGLITSQTTKTLIMEIHPMLHMQNDMHRLGNPEEILPTPYDDQTMFGDNIFQLNSITGNILSLEQEAYGLLKTKKKMSLQNKEFKCEKCSKPYKTPYALKRHMSVHDSIERRALGFLKGIQTKMEKKNLKNEEIIRFNKRKTVDQAAKEIIKARQERLEKRLKRKEALSKEQVEVKKEDKIILKIKKEPKVAKDGYECTCGQIFRRRSRMETCLRSHEIYTDTDCYSCMSCSKQFKDKDELTLHRKRLHRKRFPCKFCPTDYNTRKELFKHLQIHQRVQLMEYKVISEVVKGKKLKCFMCSKMCTELSELKSHIMEDHKEPYVCPQCNGRFSKIIDFANHTKTQHPEIEGKSVLNVLEAFSKLVKAWKCEECELQFHEADKLAMHQIEKHNPDVKPESQFQCTDCHRVFVSQKGLTSHKRIHENTDSVEETEMAEKGVMCVECRKICKDMDALTSHMRLHSPERKYPCKYCDFRFTTPEKRKTHSEIHTGDMRYVCFICEYQCSSENRLKQHKESLKHANMKEMLLTGKPIIEEDEPSTSKTKESPKGEAKKRKKDKEERKNSPSPERAKEATCDVCGDKFKSEKKMLKHKDKHPFIEIPSGDTTTRIFFK